MTDTSRLRAEPSPLPRRLRTPSWLDVRLATGVILILTSVLAGALTLSRADHREARWAITHPLAAGTVLSAADLKSVRVQLGPSDAAYVPSSEAVVGRAVNVALSAGEMLTRSALSAPPTGVAVTVPLRPDNAPRVDQGDRITLWLSTKTCQGEVLLSGAVVQGVTSSNDGSFGSDGGVVLQLDVPAADARRVVGALDLDGAVVRAGVLSAGQAAEPSSVDLAACGGGSAR